MKRTSPHPLHGYAASSCSIGDSGKPEDESIIIIRDTWLPEPNSAVAIDSRRQGQRIVSIGRLIPPTSSIHGKIGQTCPEPSNWKMICLGPRKKPGLKQSNSRSFGGKASLVDSRFGFWCAYDGIGCWADRYMHSRQRQAERNEWMA